jgi:hypothetical protein
MSKTKLIAQRFSGRPVMPDQLAAYESEFKTAFDKIQAEVGLDMLEMHKRLQALDAELLPKYTPKELMELPKSQRAWHKLIMQFECPVLVAKSSENPDTLVLVLMDQPIG